MEGPMHIATSRLKKTLTASLSVIFSPELTPGPAGPITKELPLT